MAPRTPPYQKNWPLEARHLWKDIWQAFDLQRDQIEILRTACDALSRLHQARNILDIEGITIVTATGTTRRHPCIDIERQSRMGFLSAMKALGVEWDPQAKRNVGRPAMPR